jgi:MerR family transcriptional regulator/heat shock protein HspR
MSVRVTFRRPDPRDPGRPVYVISVAASIVSVHPRTLRIYEDAGLVCPARTQTNIRLYSENDIRRVMWIRHLTQNLGVNLAGVRILFELEERLGTRILERLYDEGHPEAAPNGADGHQAEAGAGEANGNGAKATPPAPDAAPGVAPKPEPTPSTA